SARESARRTECANNLKQIGIAEIDFEQIHHRYADTLVHDFGGGSMNNPEFRPTWLAEILPNLGELALFNEEMKAEQQFRDQENYSAMLQLYQVYGIPIAVYICQSRRPVAAYYEPTNSLIAPRNTARSDYAINSGAKWLPGICDPNLATLNNSY